MDKDVLHKEIDLIQGCISRMANCSFTIKGWSVILYSAVLAITKGSVLNDGLMLLVSIVVPIVTLWMLDAFFLKKEREYRLLYDWVLENRKNDVEVLLYNLNTQRFKQLSFLSVLFSKTLWPFYGIPLLIVIIIAMLSFSGVF